MIAHHAMLLPGVKEMFSEDRALVSRLLAGDEAAFEEFVGQQAPRLYRFALARLGRNPDAAEDVTQATLVKVVPKLHTYRGEAALFSWLCTICHREIARRNRMAQGRPRPVELLEDLPQIRAALELAGRPESENPERQLLRDELGRLVQATLDHLPGRYGDALEWKYIEGQSVAQVARRLRITTIAAQSLLARARVAFREAFQGFGDAASAREGGSWGIA